MPASWACFWMTTGTWEGCGQEGSWWCCSCDLVDPGLVLKRDSERRWTRSKRNDVRFGQMAFRFLSFKLNDMFIWCQSRSWHAVRWNSEQPPKVSRNAYTIRWLNDLWWISLHLSVLHNASIYFPRHSPDEIFWNMIIHEVLQWKIFHDFSDSSDWSHEVMKILSPICKGFLCHGPSWLAERDVASVASIAEMCFILGAEDWNQWRHDGTLGWRC